MQGAVAGSDVCYKTLNPYASDGRCVYFISDVPHLIMKTTRNCWSHSFANSNTRKSWVGVQYLRITTLIFNSSLQINGQDITWQHNIIMNLYQMKCSIARESQDLFLKKLSLEHVYLTSYSRMHVDLATQVTLQMLNILCNLKLCRF